MFDLAPFFHLHEFAVTATLDGVEMRGILDRGYALGNVGTVGMASTQPVFVLPTDLIGVDPVGQLLVIGTETFVVALHEPDGTGISRLLLEVA